MKLKILVVKNIFVCTFVQQTNSIAILFDLPIQLIMKWLALLLTFIFSEYSDCASSCKSTSDDTVHNGTWHGCRESCASLNLNIVCHGCFEVISAIYTCNSDGKKSKQHQIVKNCQLCSIFIWDLRMLQIILKKIVMDNKNAISLTKSTKLK